jgi:hypothetical protein
MDAKTDILESGTDLLVKKPLPAIGSLLVFPVFILLAWLLLSDLGSPIRKYPGPWLARKSSALFCIGWAVYVHVACRAIVLGY